MSAVQPFNHHPTIPPPPPERNQSTHITIGKRLNRSCFSLTTIEKVVYMECSSLLAKSRGRNLGTCYPSTRICWVHYTPTMSFTFFRANLMADFLWSACLLLTLIVWIDVTKGFHCPDNSFTTVWHKKLSSRHILTGHTYKNSTVTAAPLTTPPAPMHSFSTFISDNRGGSNSSSKHSSPQHTASLGSSNSTDYGYMQGSVPTPPASKPPAMMRQGSYGSQFSRWVIRNHGWSKTRHYSI